MRSVQITATVPDHAAGDAYRRLSDFASYPLHSDAVRSVVVTTVDGDRTESAWEVSFRAGVLRWREEDRFDALARRIDFDQLDGDIEVFAGSWQVTEDGTGCGITFTALVDLGIPTLADVLEPIAVAAVGDNITSILRGLFGSDLAVHVEALSDAA